MNTTVEIDKAGRVVIPKKTRDAMHLRAGDRFEVEERGNELVLRPERTARLKKIDGLWVMTGVPFDFDIAKAIDQDRETRMRSVSGLSKKP